ncbi:MAG: protein TolQ [Desulfobacterales bacterium]|nr:protein TolQ [Desulfobacterales bacterium]
MIFSAGPMVKFVMLLLLIFSLLSWTIIFMKYRQFRNIQDESVEFLDSFWNSKNLADAQVSARENPVSPEAALFSHGYAELQKLGKSRASIRTGEETLEMQLATMDNLKRALRKAESRELQRLGKSLSFLATTGSATPFIGLFGTVWGIMSSFHEIGMRGSASLAVVAPGISEALVATAAGLAVAIPAVIFYNHFSNRVEDFEGDMQSFATDFLNLVERDLLARVAGRETAAPTDP